MDTNFGPSVSLTGATSDTPTFTAPDITSTTLLTFSLIVTDNVGGSSPADTVDITIQPATPPGGTSNTGNGNNSGTSGGGGAINPLFLLLIYLSLLILRPTIFLPRNPGHWIRFPSAKHNP